MKLIIHDLDEEEVKNIFPEPDEDVVLIGNSGEIRNCIGCFGCWIKTPGKCIIRDRYGEMGELLARCEEAEIISRCCYGGYSPFVKNVLDRSIPYLHPYFQIKDGEMHHRQRYEKILKLKVGFYGECISEDEKRTAEELVKANAVNLYAQVEGIRFAKTPDQLGGRQHEDSMY